MSWEKKREEVRGRKRQADHGKQRRMDTHHKQAAQHKPDPQYKQDTHRSTSLFIVVDAGVGKRQMRAGGDKHPWGLVVRSTHG